MRRQLSFHLLALSLVLSAASTVLAEEPAPATIDFPGASSTQTWGINSRGEIVGFYVSTDNVTHGFVLRWNQFRTTLVQNRFLS